MVLKEYIEIIFTKTSCSGKNHNVANISINSYNFDRVFLTGRLLMGFSIVGIEFFTKMLLYYLHEKGWSFTDHPKKGTQIRSFLKTVTWRILASLDIFIILFIILKEPIIAGSGAGIEIIAKSSAYYLHERIWNKFRLEESK